MGGGPQGADGAHRVRGGGPGPDAGARWRLRPPPRAGSAPAPLPAPLPFRPGAARGLGGIAGCQPDLRARRLRAVEIRVHARYGGGPSRPRPGGARPPLWRPSRRGLRGRRLHQPQPACSASRHRDHPTRRSRRIERTEPCGPRRPRAGGPPRGEPARSGDLRGRGGAARLPRIPRPVGHAPAHSAALVAGAGLQRHDLLRA